MSIGKLARALRRGLPNYASRDSLGFELHVYCEFARRVSSRMIRRIRVIFCEWLQSVGGPEKQRFILLDAVAHLHSDERLQNAILFFY